MDIQYSAQLHFLLTINKHGYSNISAHEAYGVLQPLIENTVKFVCKGHQKEPVYEQVSIIIIQVQITWLKSD